jgi:NAD(P)-dependent dehydrogenase (short-subunit alcohol dehydrogenase family)
MATNKTKHDFTGKVILVTGAARGLGTQITEDFLEAGGSVMMTVRNPPGELMARLSDQHPGRVDCCVLNVENEEEWIAAVDNCIDTFGGLDVLVNNAGVETQALLTECTLEDFRFNMRINVEGSFLGMKHCVRAMRPGGQAGKGGAIVNLSSIAGLRGIPSLTSYCTSKGAVRLMTKAAAVECARLDYGIRINSVHPGIVKTDMGANVVANMAALGLAPSIEAADRDVEAMHPLGYGSSQDVADVVLFLASEACPWMTGAELVCDGGCTA